MKIINIKEKPTYEEKMLFWTRLTAISVIIILGFVLIGAVKIASEYREVKVILAKIEEIDVSVLNEIVSDVNNLDIGGLTKGLSNIASELEVITADLSKINWGGLEKSVNDTAKAAQKSMEEVINAVDELDIDTLNNAIKDLHEAIQPLLSLTRLFS